jgi:hypothetical protein
LPEASIKPETGRCTPIECISPSSGSEVTLALRIELSLSERGIAATAAD